METFLSVFRVFGYFFVFAAAVFSMIASARVNSIFQRYSTQLNRRGISGAKAAEIVLRANGVHDVKIESTRGTLTDHYHPKNKTIYLSDSVYSSASTSAIGVAAHEAGHAVQHAQAYLPIRIRSVIVPAVNIGSRLAMPLIMIGLILSYLSELSFGYHLAMIGVIAFSLCVVFQLVTLPTEVNASRRALKALETESVLDAQEMEGARKTLSAAAMTYVAALAVSVTQLLRLLAIVMGRRGQRR